MFEAVLIAVIATKSPDHDLDSARAVLQAIVDEHCLQLPKERLAILSQMAQDVAWRQGTSRLY